jgi:FAD-dependent urate hydroxylase
MLFLNVFFHNYKVLFALMNMMFFRLHKILLFLLLPAFFLNLNLICTQPSQSRLKELEELIHQDLVKINVPLLPWLRFPSTSKNEILDVAIIGGGMAGLTTSFALMKEGIFNIQVFDENDSGNEGPWQTYARMQHLRSNKALMGPALEIPSLTFMAWYEACWGKSAWKELKNIPTPLWGEYLAWYQHVLNIPIKNGLYLKKIIHSDGCIELLFQEGNKVSVYRARKVVLATGRLGFGGGEVPEFIQNISKRFYAHTSEVIDNHSFKRKRVVIIGAGASAFDFAATALENDAKQVNVLVRRDRIPTTNKFAQLSFPGMFHGFYYLSNEERCEIFAEALRCGIPPPKDSIDRIAHFENIHLFFKTYIERIIEKRDCLVIVTNRGEFVADFVILATGYDVDGYQRPELADIIDKILLWQDFVPEDILQTLPKLGRFPFLGEHFQFLEKKPGQAPFLKDLYCFNYGSYLSHGLISGDIPGISFGAARLASGIARDFFIEQSFLYKQAVFEYNKELFDPGKYEIFSLD